MPITVDDVKSAMDTGFDLGVRARQEGENPGPDGGTEAIAVRRRGKSSHKTASKTVRKTVSKRAGSNRETKRLATLRARYGTVNPAEVAKIIRDRKREGKAP
jgi:hypothetical protein